LLSLLGQRSHLLAFVTDPRSAPTDRKAGEVILWSKHGQRIWLHQDGSMTLDAPASITVNSPEVTLTADKAVLNANTIDLGGEGGEQVACIGDMVKVSGGSSAGLHPIVSGSKKVRAV